MAGEPVTQLLQQLSEGNREAFDALMPLVYSQLRKLAGSCLRNERPGHTLRATALVHEAYLKLVDADVAWESRVHFYAVAARVMRRILVDHAKAGNRRKRGGGAEVVQFDEAVMVGPDVPDSIMALDEALVRLAKRDQRKSDVVECLFFGGMTYDETAAALAISPATVHRELKMAKAWLYNELAQSASAGLST
jgi:RNA polymerase sigma factor (TIGR02999 family)